MDGVKLRKRPKDIFTELNDIAKTFESYVMVERPLRTQDVQELSWLLSVAEERVQRYGEYMHELGKSEKGLFE